MNNNESSTSSTVIGILVIVVIAVVGWICYTQGVFETKEEVKDTSSGVQINLGGSSDSPDTTNSTK